MYHSVLNASTIDSKENNFIDFQLQFEATHYLCNASPQGGGLVPEKLEGDVQPASRIPYRSYDQWPNSAVMYDQNLRYSLTYLRPDNNSKPCLWSDS